VVTIGIVNATPMRDELVILFQEQLAMVGYADDEQVQYIYPGAITDTAERDEWASELAARDVDLMLAVTTPGARSAVQATDQTPILFVPITDPIGSDLVDDLQFPGGNVTGITNGNPHPVRLQLLADLDPSIRRVYVPLNAVSGPVQGSIAEIRAAADELGIELIEDDLRTAADIEQAIADLPADIDAIFVTPDPLVASFSSGWVTAATQAGIPTSSLSRAESLQGITLTYGEEMPAVAAQAARMAVIILQGTSPGDLPVETTEYFLSLNLAAAEAIDLEIPESLLRRADFLVRERSPALITQ
jgi:putative ABC transport system substrate-binding protein